MVPGAKAHVFSRIIVRRAPQAFSIAPFWTAFIRSGKEWATWGHGDAACRIRMMTRGASAKCVPERIKLRAEIKSLHHQLFRD